MAAPSSPRPPGGPPPGVYPDARGVPRWWDGQRWGDPVPPPGAPAGGADAGGSYPPAGYGYGVPIGATRNPRSMALWAHVGGLLGGWIAPLVVYLMDGGRDRYVRHNASEGLNFQLTVQLVALILMVPFFALFFGPFVAGTTAPRGRAPTPAFGAAFGGFFVVWGVMMLVSVANIALSITGMVKANRGEWWRYPVRIRFVKGFVPPEERYPV